MAPSRETVGFVDDKTGDGAPHQQPLDGFGAEHLGGDIEQVGCAVCHLGDGCRPFNGVEQAVDGHSVGDAAFSKVVHLVFHQRLQGRDDHRQAVDIATGHEGRKLEGERFAASRGKDGQQRFAPYGGFYGLLLHGDAVECAETVVAEELFQPLVRVEPLLAIGASTARRVAEEVHHIGHPGVVACHPCGGVRLHVVSPYDGKGVGQLDRVVLDYCGDVCIAADFPFVLQGYQLHGVAVRGIHAQVLKETAELLDVLQQVEKDCLSSGRQLMPSCHFVVEQVAGFQCIVGRIVDLVGLQLVVFDQAMVWFLREKQRGKEQRVNYQVSVCQEC